MEQIKQFKVGDIVRFKTWEELRCEFGYYNNETIYLPHYGLVHKSSYLYFDNVATKNNYIVQGYKEEYNILYVIVKKVNNHEIIYTCQEALKEFN